MSSYLKNTFLSFIILVGFDSAGYSSESTKIAISSKNPTHIEAKKKGIKVTYTQISTDAFSSIGKFAALNARLILKEGYLIRDKIREGIAKNAPTNPDYKWVERAYGLGGAALNHALHRLTPEERQFVIARTFGSACIIKPHMAFSVKNYVNDKDFVPLFTDPIRMAIGLGQSHIILMHTKDKSFLGPHAYLNYYAANMEVRNEIRQLLKD